MKGKLRNHYCMDKACGWEETTHKIRDGISCPKCGGPVMSIDKKAKCVEGEVMTKEMPGLTVTVDMNSDNLSRKLKAIAKHAKALAEELDGIDQLLALEEQAEEVGRNTETTTKDLAYALAKLTKCNKVHSLGFTEEEIQDMCEMMKLSSAKRNLES